jgi:isoprenylcysteine carboxyl methyltransferase (ICMT) family protein YpbQ
MNDNLYAPPESPVEDMASKPYREPGRDFALAWRIAFLLLFACLNIYFCVGQRFNWDCLAMAVLSITAALLFWRLSSWSRYPLYLLTLNMSAAIVGGLYNYVRHPEPMSQPFERQIIGWLIPVVPTYLLLLCCVSARRLGRVI